MTGGRTAATVHLTDPPHIDGAETLGMVADIKSSVESGTEIDSRTYTFIAYLGNYYAFTTLTTDPGSVVPGTATAIRRRSARQNGVHVAQLSARLG